MNRKNPVITIDAWRKKITEIGINVWANEREPHQMRKNLILLCDTRLGTGIHNIRMPAPMAVEY